MIPSSRPLGEIAAVEGVRVIFLGRGERSASLYGKCEFDLDSS